MPIPIDFVKMLSCLDQLILSIVAAPKSTHATICIGVRSTSDLLIALKFNQAAGNAVSVAKSSPNLLSISTLIFLRNFSLAQSIP